MLVSLPSRFCEWWVMKRMRQLCTTRGKTSGYYTCAVNFRVDQKKKPSENLRRWKKKNKEGTLTKNRTPESTPRSLMTHLDKFWDFFPKCLRAVRIKFGIFFLQNATSEIRIKIGTQSWNRTIAHHTTIEPVVSLTIIINERNRHQIGSDDDEGRDCCQCEVWQSTELANLKDYLSFCKLPSRRR